MDAPYQSPESSEAPPPMPGAPPRIPRGKLWTALLLPSVIVILTNGLIVVSSKKEAESALNILLTLPIALVAIICSTALFTNTIRQVYRGRSRVLLCLGYFFGEVIVALAVWFGSCLALMGMH